MKKNLKDLSTKLEVLELVLGDRPVSAAEAGRQLGIPARTLQDFIARKTHKEWWKLYDNAECESQDTYSAECSTAQLDDSELWYPFKNTPKEIHGKDCGEDNSSVLIISDLHIPYHHPDALEFLQHLKDKYNPTRIICSGDELDKHALSFHDHDPNLPSAGDELRLSLPVIQKLKEMFPKMDILESNHGSLLYRKAHANGIPRQYLKSYNEVLNVGEGWKWWYDMTITLPDGNKCYFHHGKSNNVTKTSQTMSMCAVQGHYHETFKIEYWGNPNGLFWGMQCGCLIDDKSLAFNYNNVNLKRPIIGTGVIVDSQPILEPMVLDNNGRWVKA